MSIQAGEPIEPDSVVFVVQWDCQDYYCDGEHVLGVYATRSRAERAIEDEKAANASDSYRATYTYSAAEYPLST